MGRGRWAGRSLGAVCLVGVVATVVWGRGGIETHGPVVSDERPWLAWGVGSGNDALVGGTLGWAGDCLLLSGRAVVWPSGTRWDADAEVLELPDGLTARAGDSISGGGGAFGGADDEGWDDSDAGRATADCQAPGTEVTVFNRTQDDLVVDAAP